jgi:hypothetical protein
MIILIGVVFTTYFFHDKFNNNTLKNKEYLIKNYNPKIIFSGDSRAERQLNVREAIKLLNLESGDVVNIAISSGDPIMVNNLIDKYPNKFKNSTIVLSISANQMNDNAKLPVYFTYSMISKLNYLEQVNTFMVDGRGTLLRYYYQNIKNYIKQKLDISKKNNQFESSFGFNGIDTELNTSTIRLNILKNNPWYINYADGGIKYKLINDSLNELKQKVKRLYVYTAAFSPTYIDVVENTDLLKHELSFKKKIQVICQNNGIEYKNYLHLNALQDNHFYDISHLNREGSKIFTKIVLKDFNIK